MGKKNREKMDAEEEMKESVTTEETTETAETASEESAGISEDTAEETAEAAEENPLAKELEEAKAKSAEYLAMAQRVQADFENYRKRNESIRADAYADGRKDVASVMLPILDNLERAVDAAAASTDEALKNGVELVLRQMIEIYRKLDVKPIDRLGEKFDPNLENAVLQGNEDEGEPGTVCQVLQKGYQMGDRVLRHAMVKVVAE
jgi:molecular chaperone GrpE